MDLQQRGDGEHGGDPFGVQTIMHVDRQGKLQTRRTLRIADEAAHRADGSRRH